MQAVTTIGLDIAKSVFQVHGIDAIGNNIACTAIANGAGGIGHMSGFGTSATSRDGLIMTASGSKAEVDAHFRE